jgi:hypothetical protein
LYIEDIGRISFLFPILFYYFNRKPNEKSIRLVFYYAVFYILEEFVYYAIKIYFSAFWGDILNLFFSPIELLLIVAFFKSTYRSQRNKTIGTSLAICYCLIWSISTLFDNSLEFNSIMTSLVSLVVIFLSILFFYEQFRKPSTVFIYGQSVFWGVVGFFIFKSGTFFIFLYRQTSGEIDDFINQYVHIHVVLLIIQNTFFSITTFFYKPKYSIA